MANRKNQHHIIRGGHTHTYTHTHKHTRMYESDIAYDVSVLCAYQIVCIIYKKITRPI